MHNVMKATAYTEGFDFCMGGGELEDCPYKSSVSQDWARGFGVAQAIKNARLRKE